MPAPVEFNEVTYAIETDGFDFVEFTADGTRILKIVGFFGPFRRAPAPFLSPVRNRGIYLVNSVERRKRKRLLITAAACNDFWISAARMSRAYFKAAIGFGCAAACAASTSGRSIFGACIRLAPARTSSAGF